MLLKPTLVLVRNSFRVLKSLTDTAQLQPAAAAAHPSNDPCALDVRSARLTHLLACAVWSPKRCCR